MSLNLDARQRAMLQEMGITIWWPKPAAAAVAAPVPVAQAAAMAVAQAPVQATATAVVDAPATAAPAATAATAAAAAITAPAAAPQPVPATAPARPAPHRRLRWHKPQKMPYRTPPGASPCGAGLPCGDRRQCGRRLADHLRKPQPRRATGRRHRQAAQQHAACAAPAPQPPCLDCLHAAPRP